MTKNINYFNNENLNATLIKNLNDYKDFKETESLILGSLVDFYATENISEFEKYFWIDEIDKMPRPQIKQFIDCIFCNQKNILENLFKKMSLNEKVIEDKEIISYDDGKLSGYFIITEDLYNKAFKEVDFKKKSMESILNEFYENLDYYRYIVKKYLYQNNNRKIVTKYNIEKAKRCFDKILSSQFKKYFIKNDKNMEIYHQVEIYWYDNCNKKAKLDILYIDHIEKKIGIKDLKTMSDDTINFLTSFIKFRYDIQMNHYYESLKNLINAKSNCTELPNYIKKLMDKGYSYEETFGFIVASTEKECDVFEYYFYISDNYYIKQRRLNTSKDILEAINIYNICLKNELNPSLSNYYKYILNGRILCNNKNII